MRREVAVQDLRAVLASGEYPLPLSGPEQEWINQAIEDAVRAAN